MTDPRWRFLVEDRYGNVVVDWLDVQQPKVTRRLSGPSEIEFQLDPRNPQIQFGGRPLRMKSWGYWLHAALPTANTGSDAVVASCLVQPSDIDPTTGIVALRSQGFSAYPKGMPWLQNWNPVTVYPYDIVRRIWDHLQSYPNGNLGVTVQDRYHPSDGYDPPEAQFDPGDPDPPPFYPPRMLPGFTFKDEKFIGNFFAAFIRAADKNDCGDYIDALARDTPFEYREFSRLITTGAGGVQKILQLGYPFIGTVQESIVFRLGENVLQAKASTESQIRWASDVILDGFWPGNVYSSSFSNADPDRYRRVVMESDVNIDSNERAAVWAKRQLQRRQKPPCYEQVVIDPYHSNAPLGSFDVGDFVRVQAMDPWMGQVNLQHKVMAIVYDIESGLVSVELEPSEPNNGAFNYDPINYVQYGIPLPPPNTANFTPSANIDLPPPSPPPPPQDGSGAGWIGAPNTIGTKGQLFPRAINWVDQEPGAPVV